VRGIVRLHARLLTVAVSCAVCGAAAAVGAETPKSSNEQKTALRQANQTLAQRMHGATLELYSLDVDLKRVQARLTSLGFRREAFTRARRSVQLQLNASRHALRVSQRQLAVLVHSLYEQQVDDPLAIVLGAQSLEEAITTLDDLGHAARQNQQIAARSRAAQSSLVALKHRLAREDAHVRALEAAALRTSASLAAARTSRRQYVSALSARRALNGAQISRIDALASTSAAASVAPTATQTSDASAQPSNDMSSSRSITVVATGYSLHGTTATGLPVGWGTIAVDPSVIPLGTSMTIPGYGEGVAADTGDAVRAATIDLWFPTVPQALAWGQRVVTVTLH
jgi:3D (Asp-Asp-Asp) domain-containing protein